MMSEFYVFFSQSYMEIFPLQVICLYPKFLPSNTRFTRSAPPLHEIADINQLCRGNDNLIQQYKTFLCSYLEDIKGTKLAVGFKQVYFVDFVIHAL